MVTITLRAGALRQVSMFLPNTMTAENEQSWHVLFVQLLLVAKINLYDSHRRTIRYISSGSEF
jgi:hypothetical protein